MAVNPKSLENLTTPKPGEVRNPKGKPKGPNTKTILLKLLSAKIKVKDDNGEETGEEMTAHEMMLSKLLQGALTGNRKYVESILDRIDGKPISTSIIADADGEFGSLSKEEKEAKLADLLRKING